VTTPEPEDLPVPFTLTPQAEAALDTALTSDFPVAASPEVIAAWFGCASVAEMEASEARYAAERAREMAIEDEMDTRFDAEAERQAEAEAEPEDPQAAPAWHPGLAPPMTDAFYRAIGDYCPAENAKLEPEPEAEL
jgi:hypothetical protein